MELAPGIVSFYSPNHAATLLVFVTLGPDRLLLFSSPPSSCIYLRPAVSELYNTRTALRTASVCFCLDLSSLASLKPCHFVNGFMSLISQIANLQRDSISLSMLSQRVVKLVNTLICIS